MDDMVAGERHGLGQEHKYCQQPELLAEICMVRRSHGFFLTSQVTISIAWLTAIIIQNAKRNGPA